MTKIQDGKFRKKTSFAMVSNVALRDASLSLKAKGLYAFIQSYITLEGFTLYKAFIFNSHEKDGVKGINSAWKELKDNGYLKQFKIRVIGDDGKAAFKYEYELLDEPDTTTPSTINLKLDGTVSEENSVQEGNSSDEQIENKINQTDKTSQDYEYKAIKEEVSKRLGIDVELEEHPPEDMPFAKISPDALSIRDIIVEVLLSKDKVIKIGKVSLGDNHPLFYLY